MIAPEKMGSSGTHRLNYGWVLRLRWAAICGQAATIIGVYWAFSVALPLGPLALIIGFSILSNFVAAFVGRRLQKITDAHIAGLLLLDVGCLTALLYFSGGPNNPFSFLYLIHAALAAVTLSTRLTWLVGVTAISAMGALFWGHHGMGDHHHHGPEEMRMHVRGMWVACALGAVFIVYFIGRIRGSLAAVHSALERARRDAERARRVASLTTLAAGAAHELATPLATIAVAAREMERQIEGDKGREAFADDAKLIRQETARCHAVLERLSVAAGRQDPDEFYTIELADLLDDALELLGGRERVEVELSEVVGATVTGPLTALAQTVRALLINAQQASGADHGVRVVGYRDDEERLVLDIQDRGPALSDAHRERIGEPFFTTKGVGGGTGLGVFLARAVLDGIGATLAYLPDSTQGTITRVTFPTPFEESTL